MKITDSIYLVASGKWGFSFTHPLDCNVFLIDTGDGCMVIDAGVNLEPERMAAVIASHGFAMTDIKQLLLTHYHADHAAGSAFIKRASGCEVYAPAGEADAIAAGDEVATSVALGKGILYPADYVLEPCPVTPLNDGDTVELGDITITGYTLPGHSKEGMVYYGEIDGKRCLFTGDGVFAAGQVLIQSLHDVSLFPYAEGMRSISKLPVDALFPGHGVFVLEDGGDHIQAALKKFNAGLIPPQLYYFA